jgi:hypothetical protein
LIEKQQSEPQTASIASLSWFDSSNQLKKLVWSERNSEPQVVGSLQQVSYWCPAKAMFAQLRAPALIPTAYLTKNQNLFGFLSVFPSKREGGFYQPKDRNQVYPFILSKWNTKFKFDGFVRPP